MHKLFTTHIYQKKINAPLKELTKECFQIQKADHEGQNWSVENYVNGYTSYGSWDQIHKLSTSFQDLQKKIDKHVWIYATQHLNYRIKKNELRMNTFWVNIMPSGASHNSHIHPNSVVSGTYYLQTPNACSGLKFEDPRLAFFMNSPSLQTSCKKENLRFFTLNPKAGEVVLFESWMRHEVPTNKSKTPRISVSFNYS